MRARPIAASGAPEVRRAAQRPETRMAHVQLHEDMRDETERATPQRASDDHHGEDFGCVERQQDVGTEDRVVR